MYAKLNNIKSAQRTLSQIPEMRQSFRTRAYRYLIGTTAFMGTLIFLYCVDVIKPITWAVDVLPSAEDPNFSPKTQSVFFHETFRGRLTVRQACAVEAAARAHPKKDIYVLFSVPVTEYDLKAGCHTELLQIPNVKFMRVHPAEYSKGTVVQSILLNDVVQSKYRKQHTADILRILTLNKWGGIYLDTDMIVTKSLEHLPANFVAKEGAHDMASAIISFAKDEIGTNVTNNIIKDISKNYKPLNWSHTGAKAIERVLEKLCPNLMRSEDNCTRPFIICKGVTVFDYELFYPQHFLDAKTIFEPAPEDFDLNRPYTYHMYDFLTHNMTVNRGSIYELVAKAFCPTMYSSHSDEFSGKEIKVGHDSSISNFLRKILSALPQMVF